MTELAKLKMLKGAANKDSEKQKKPEKIVYKVIVRHIPVFETVSVDSKPGQGVIDVEQIANEAKAKVKEEYKQLVHELSQKLAEEKLANEKLRYEKRRHEADEFSKHMNSQIKVFCDIYRTQKDERLYYSENMSLELSYALESDLKVMKGLIRNGVRIPNMKRLVISHFTNYTDLDTLLRN